MSNRERHKKLIERAYLARFLELSGRTGTVVDSESPDFLITNNSGTEGVEVTQILVESRSEGSAAKNIEKKHAQFLAKVAALFYARGGLPAIVKVHLTADVTEDQGESLVRLLLQHRALLHPWSQCAVPWLGKDRGLYITALPDASSHYDRWICISDVVGWVHTISDGVLTEIIQSKAKRLHAYRSSVARVTLLIVADHLTNAGKLRLSFPSCAPDAAGFDAVYLLEHPELLHHIASA